MALFPGGSTGSAAVNTVAARAGEAAEGERDRGTRSGTRGSGRGRAGTHLLALDGAAIAPLHGHGGSVRIHRLHRRLLDQAWKRPALNPGPATGCCPTGPGPPRYRPPTDIPLRSPPLTVTPLNLNDAAGTDEAVGAGLHGPGTRSAGGSAAAATRPSPAVTPGPANRHRFKPRAPACRGAYRETRAGGLHIPACSARTDAYRSRRALGRGPGPTARRRRGRRAARPRACWEL